MTILGRKIRSNEDFCWGLAFVGFALIDAIAWQMWMGTVICGAYGTYRILESFKPQRKEW